MSKVFKVTTVTIEPVLYSTVYQVTADSKEEAEAKALIGDKSGEADIEEIDDYSDYDSNFDTEIDGQDATCLELINKGKTFFVESCEEIAQEEVDTVKQLQEEMDSINKQREDLLANWHDTFEKLQRARNGIMH